MTTASVPATSSERRNPLFQNTKNRIASLSSKNEEVNNNLIILFKKSIKIDDFKPVRILNLEFC